MNCTTPHWLLVNIASGNGLVPPGNKPLPGPILTQTYILNIGRCSCDLELVIIKLIWMIDILSIFWKLALRWMPQDLMGWESTLLQGMVWCHQATNLYLSHCSLKFMSTYGITRSQWVNPCHEEFLVEISQHIFQVIAWCRQATSHYLSQCWPRSMSPYGVTSPEWVNP